MQELSQLEQGSQTPAVTGIRRKTHLASSLSLYISGRLATALYRNGRTSLGSCLESTSKCTSQHLYQAVSGNMPQRQAFAPCFRCLAKCCRGPKRYSQWNLRLAQSTQRVERRGENGNGLDFRSRNEARSLLRCWDRSAAGTHTCEKHSLVVVGVSLVLLPPQSLSLARSIRLRPSSLAAGKIGCAGAIS